MPFIAFDHASRKQNRIALTFDDGPNPFWTGRVLDVLDSYKVKANFFVLGKWAEAYPEIVKEIFDRGHLVGNHSYSHSKEIGDFDKAEEIIFKVIGEHTKFIRPSYLDVKLCANYVLAQCVEVKIINTDVFPLDHMHNATEIIDFAVKHTQDGSIILLHDGSNHEKDLKRWLAEMFAALPQIIASLQAKFEFRRLDEMEFDR
jgi:peptidoglycan/xylan/chitin deacetylase (PgdA/CDA1 family)